MTTPAAPRIRMTVLLIAGALAAGVAIGALVAAARDGSSAAGPDPAAVAPRVIDALPSGKEAIRVELAFAPGGLRYVAPGNR